MISVETSQGFLVVDRGMGRNMEPSKQVLGLIISPLISPYRIFQIVPPYGRHSLPRGMVLLFGEWFRQQCLALRLKFLDKAFGLK